MKDRSTGSRTRFVITSAATPTLAINARVWMTSIFIVTSTANPTVSHSSAVNPAINKRRVPRPISCMIPFIF